MIYKKLKKLIKNPTLFIFDLLKKRIIKKGLVDNSININELYLKNNILYQSYINNINTNNILTTKLVWDDFKYFNKVIGLQETFLANQKYFFLNINEYKANEFVNNQGKHVDKSLEYVIIHGYSYNIDRAYLLKYIQFYNLNIFYSEDGFISSIVRPVESSFEYIYNFGCSKTIDTIAPYFDATKVTQLEFILNSEYSITEQEINRSKNIIALLIDNYISKYNNQPIFNPFKDIKQKKVLVLDQACNDWSITKGFADENTFIEMLECAIQENPDAQIFVKVHPDMISNPNRGNVHNKVLGHYTNFNFSNYKNVHIISTYVNPISILKSVDKVYVCTSQMGFESLLCGKETHIFGSPFYAGWGVGVQRKHSLAIKRRTKKRNIYEIFYIAYVLYSKYFNPLTRKQCEIEEIINFIIYSRKRFFYDFNVVQYCDHNLLNLKYKESFLDIVFSLDENYIIPCIISILSLLQAETKNNCCYNIFLLIDEKFNISYKDIILDIIKSQPKCLSIQFILVDKSFINSFEIRGITKSTYYRLLIPQIFKDKSKIIYCDSDFLFNQGLEDLLDFQLGDFLISGCIDVGLNSNYLFNKKLKQISYWHSYFYDIRKSYINAGFLIFNLSKIKENINLQKEWIKLSEKEHIHQDQDIINYTCKHKILLLNTKFNVIPRYLSNNGYDLAVKEGFVPASHLSVIKENPVAFHFAGKKPWKDKKVIGYEKWISCFYKNKYLLKNLLDMEIFNDLL